LRRGAQRSDAHEPGQQYDHDHTTDRRGVLQSALARLGSLVIGDVVDVVVGRCRSSRRDCIVDVVVR
jgi:hypothetical protein